MSNEESEMKCEYKALSGLRDKYRFDQFFTPLDYKLQDHHKEGPTKVCLTLFNLSVLDFL